MTCECGIVVHIIIIITIIIRARNDAVKPSVCINLTHVIITIIARIILRVLHSKCL